MKQHMKTKSKIWTIVKKELSRFFGDKRMVISVIMPGIIVYAMYTFMGDAMGGMFTVDSDYEYKLEAVNMPASVSYMLDAADVKFDIIDIKEGDVESAKEKISASELDLLLVFTEGFDEIIASGSDIPNVSIYYNSTNTSSSGAMDLTGGMLSGYESSLSRAFDINAGGDTYDLADEKDMAGMIFSMMMPMLLMMFLFSGCMSVAPESIAGEKERGTIATLLITPLKRSELAIGKILALSVMALISGASSTLGTLLSLPKLTGMSSEQLNASVYGVVDYIALSGVIISTVLIIIALISIISAFAKTIKEAQMWVTPLMIVVMLIGLTGMLGNGAKTELYYYFIPLYNSVQSMVSVFTFELSTTNVMVCIGSNICFSVLGMFLLTRMFENEKILFSK